MSKIRQILRCYAAGNGAKKISRLLDVARNTVKRYLRKLNESGMTVGKALELSDTDLAMLLDEQEDNSRQGSPRQDEFMDILPKYAKMLRRRGVRKIDIYRQYREDYPDGYSRSRFFSLLARYQYDEGGYAHLEHKPGDKMYIDFAGDRLRLVDPETGEVTPVEVFVAVLPYSQYTYVEAVMSQKKEDLIRATENALHFFGGTPQAIVPDNLKAAVTKPNKYESVINDDFASFAEHYGCVVFPARVRHPKDKALVEGAVRIIYRTIYPSIRQQDFHDLESLNVAIRMSLALHNSGNLTGRPFSRLLVFKEQEQGTLGPLAAIRFEMARRHEATVLCNGHVKVGNQYYSVPHEYMRRKVMVVYDSSTVRVFYRYALIAVHEVGNRPYGYNTKKEHLPKSQQSMLNWDPDQLLLEAEKLDVEIRDYMEKVIQARRYPELAYKSCRGILAIANRVGVERTVKACRVATEMSMFNYQAIDQIIISGKETMLDEPVQPDDPDEVVIEHDNLRGSDYYK